MLSTTALNRKYFRLSPVREFQSYHSLSIHHLFPLLKRNKLLPRVARHFEDYQGRRQVDVDHLLPVLQSRSNAQSQQHVWTNWDKRLNPQIITSVSSLKPLDEYVGPKTGILLAKVGWRRQGGSWRFKNHYKEQRSPDKKEDEWLERNVTPRWKLVPRIADFNPQQRYPGKLEYVEVKLSQIIWAIDCGKLNRNEVITLWHLNEAGVLNNIHGEESQTTHNMNNSTTSNELADNVVWPGVKLVDDGVQPRYPISLELQNGTPEAIKRIEDSGGSFVSAYLSLDGLYQTMHPEEYPVFMDQHLPDRPGMQTVAMSDQARGYLCRFYENEAKYAHPEAGRRLSHYVRPPTDRDFPATFEEYERVRHHQKWHLGQPGTGTVLPFISMRSLEDKPKPPTKLQS